MTIPSSGMWVARQGLSRHVPDMGSKWKSFARLAQRIEHQICNLEVTGSTPVPHRVGSKPTFWKGHQTCPSMKPKGGECLFGRLQDCVLKQHVKRPCRTRIPPQRWLGNGAYTGESMSSEVRRGTKICLTAQRRPARLRLKRLSAFSHVISERFAC